MNRLQAINRLDFYYQRIINEQIKAKSVAKLGMPLYSSGTATCRCTDTCAIPTPAQKRQFVGRFKQTWSEFAMNPLSPRQSPHRTVRSNPSLRPLRLCDLRV